MRTSCIFILMLFPEGAVAYCPEVLHTPIYTVTSLLLSSRFRPLHETHGQAQGIRFTLVTSYSWLSSPTQFIALYTPCLSILCNPFMDAKTPAHQCMYIFGVGECGFLFVREYRIQDLLLGGSSKNKDRQLKMVHRLL